ncbi:MAG: divalent-cation tolerance protein CutA [Deltaproteobacteria bacterium]|nr:divalent-cation tolerance protein CutA [Deltaproteobacteria bacterium]
MSEKGIVVFVTTPSHSVAADIAKTIVSERLAACVNIIPNIRSIFFWDNKVQDEQETLMIIKTSKDLFEPLKKRVIMTHPYSVPEIISIEIQDGHKEYLQWIFETVLSK